MRLGLYRRDMRASDELMEQLDAKRHDTIVAIIGKDGNVDNIVIRLEVDTVNGELVVTETSGRRLRIVPNLSNSIRIDVEPHFRKKV